MKEFFKNLWNNKLVKVIGSIVVGLFVLSLVFYVANTWPRQSVIDQIVKERQVEIEKKFQEQIDLKNGEIDSLNTRIAQSEQEYASLKSKYSKLKKDYANVEKPKDTQDTKRRLNAMGYTTR